MDLYRAYYCGLCRAMRRGCGWAAGMVLNYDFTFLAILLAPTQGTPVERCRRCPVRPFRRVAMCAASPALEIAADESVILAYHQLCDTVRDDGFFSGLPARVLRWLLCRGYRKAVRRRPEFDRIVRQQLEQLHKLEQENCPGLDAPADAFACLLQAAAPKSGEDARDRAAAQLLYHMGRWIYLLDARDDLESDEKRGSYNPVALRYAGQPDADAALRATLDRSLDLMRSACALLELGRQEELVNNVLWLGMPAVCQAVFDGRWAQMKKHRIWRKGYE